MKNLYYDSAAFTAIAYTSAVLKNFPQSQWDTIPKIQEMPVVKALIEDLCVKKADVITQINVRKTGDVEIRFGTEEHVKDFVLEKGTYVVGEHTV